MIASATLSDSISRRSSSAMARLADTRKLVHLSRRADKKEDSAYKRTKSQKLLERLSWLIRTCLAAFIASLITLWVQRSNIDMHNAKISARVFAPIAAVVCSTATIGATIQAVILVVLASALGGMLSLVAVFGANLFPGAYTILLAIAAFAVLIPTIKPPFVKMFLVTCTTSLSHTATAGPLRDPMQPLVVVIAAW
eukprot:2548445-Rhodomonas_salina.1